MRYFLKTIPLLTLVFSAIELNGQIFVNDDATGNNDGTSWENAYTQLHDALEVANTGDEVWVAGGTYKPSAIPGNCVGCSNAADYTFLIKDGVSLYGGFNGTESQLAERGLDFIPNLDTLSILDGNINQGGFTNVKHVVIFFNNGGNSTINGFTITGGDTSVSGGAPIYFGKSVDPDNGGGIYALSSGFESTSYNAVIANNVIGSDDPLVDANTALNGGGIYVKDGNFLIRNNLIGYNSATNNGGGIYVATGDLPPKIEGNEFSGNIANNNGGGVFVFAGSGVSEIQIVENGFVSNNANNGGAIYLQGGTSIIEYNGIFVNSVETNGAGIFVNGGDTTISYNYIGNNFINSVSAPGNPPATIGQGGGIYIQGGVNRLNNNHVGGNKSFEGGGIFATGSTTDLVNNSIYFNLSRTSGAGFDFSGVNATLLNNTIVFNHTGFMDGEYSGLPFPQGAAENKFSNCQGYLGNNIIWGEYSAFDSDTVLSKANNILRNNGGGTDVDVNPFFSDASLNEHILNFDPNSCSDSNPELCFNPFVSLVSFGDDEFPLLNFGLRPDSFAIDNGNTAAYNSIPGNDAATDVDVIGKSRFVGPQIDIGAFEYRDKFSVGSNGVTCLCPDAAIGESGTLNIDGFPTTFTKRSREQLEALIINDPNDPQIRLTCTSGIADMSGLFGSAPTFNQDISSWDVSSVTNMEAMFINTVDFDQDISVWDVSRVTNMNRMFSNAQAFNQDISVWDVSRVADMSEMFSNTQNFNQDISFWNVAKVTDMDFMFFQSGFFQDISNWCVEAITTEPINFSDVLLPSFRPNWGEFCLSFELDQNGVTCLCTNAAIGTTDVLDINGVFIEFTKRSRAQLDALIASDPNDPQIARSCTSGITDMSNMFRNLPSFNQDISSWDVSSVVNMEAMFLNASSFNQQLNFWNVSNVTNMFGMFSFATSFNGELFLWDVSNVNTMGSMFRGASSFNQFLNSWNVSNVSDMASMFEGATNFNRSLGAWDISNVINMSNMFNNVTLSSENYDALLNGWATLDVGETAIPQNMTFSGGNSQYCSALGSRELLETTFGWSITDGGRLQVVWNGSVSSDWNTAENWSTNALPEDCANIIIPSGTINPLVISGTLEVQNVQLNSGSSMTVPNGATLNINGNLDLYSTSDTFSSLLVNGNISVSGNTRYHRYTNAQLNRNDLISPPLSGQSWSSFLTNDNNHNAAILFNDGVDIPNTTYLFGPFEKGATDDYIVYNYQDNVTLISGRGYRSATNTQQVNGNGEPLIFTGSILTGNVDVPIINDVSGNFPEWNLIGNPYPAYIDINTFLNHEVSPGVTNLSLLSGPTAAIYGYNANDTNGSLWTITNLVAGPELIAPGQGFFVSSSNSSANIQFTPNMQVNGNADDFVLGRSSSPSHSIDLTMNNADSSYSTAFYFNDIASSGLDAGYDAGIFGGTPPEFSIYSHLVEDNEDMAMAIQTLNTSALNNVVIPIGVKANQGQELNFILSSISLPSSVEVYLEDALNGTYTLLNISTYTITANEEINGTGRFYIHFTESSLSLENNNINKLNVYSNPGEGTIIIEGTLQNGTQANIYDLLGRNVSLLKLDISITRNILKLDGLNSGVYIIKIENGVNSVSKKVIIK
ncbi:BspA family leucine-rich repeat surface protein [Winogradskyella aquimaris]|uniref:BspA family leucine-rich repeat surface protein n=1 Tax=Winogradskyella aquimaris TaxID=864074 RepID=A0ABU5EQ45_9FLAO|nr:BspA family leucine-rich repeat surface protein [Winogradskyella aquimaris]MDY2588191.1 BspA family leucine-rich repeat surface protein [Winogradskyella aquimaris]